MLLIILNSSLASLVLGNRFCMHTMSAAQHVSASLHNAARNDTQLLIPQWRLMLSRKSFGEHRFAEHASSLGWKAVRLLSLLLLLLLLLFWKRKLVVAVQGASPQHANKISRGGDAADWYLPPAADGQVQLHQVCIHSGTILPEL